MNVRGIERRRSTRERRSTPVWWRTGEAGDFRTGWMLESSAHGAAFVTRTESVPRPGALIEATLTDPEPGHPAPEIVARVRRVRRVHGDLFLIAAEIDAPDADERRFRAAVAEAARLGTSFGVLAGIVG